MYILKFIISVRCTSTPIVSQKMRSKLIHFQYFGYVKFQHFTTIVEFSIHLATSATRPTNDWTMAFSAPISFIQLRTNIMHF